MKTWPQRYWQKIYAKNDSIPDYKVNQGIKRIHFIIYGQVAKS